MGSQFDIFPWNRDFEVGIPVIDDQHRKLVALINRLALGIVGRNDQTTLDAMIAALSDYTVYHFSAEELIWRQHIGEDKLFESHHQTHEKFLAFLDSVKRKQDGSSTPQTYKKIVTFLTNWLVSHILETDKNMAQVCLLIDAGRTLQQAKQEAQNARRNSKKILSQALVNMNNDLSDLSFRMSVEIEQRKKTEAELARALHFSKALVKSMHDGLITFDKFGAISEVNPALCKMTGYRVKELVGLAPPFPFCAHEKHVEFDQVLQRSQTNFEIEVTLIRKDGSTFPAIVSLFHIQDGADQLITSAATIKDITESKHIEAEKIRLAFYDSLTNLANRRLFSEQLEHTMEDSLRNGTSFAVAFIDLDHFKQLNDTKGHTLGDILLKEVAHRLKDSVRAIDTVARFGGDEFVVLMNDFKSDEARRDAEQISQKIRGVLREPYCLKAENDAQNPITYHCTASIGVAISQGRLIGKDELLTRADTAMYRAKAKGRDTVCFDEQ